MMGIYAGRTEPAQSAEMKERQLNRRNFDQQLEVMIAMHSSDEFISRSPSINNTTRDGMSYDTCGKAKKCFLIIVIKVVKKYSSHPTSFTTMLQSKTNNHLHDLFWRTYMITIGQYSIRRPSIIAFVFR